MVEAGGVGKAVGVQVPRCTQGPSQCWVGLRVGGGGRGLHQRSHPGPRKAEVGSGPAPLLPPAVLRKRTQRSPRARFLFSEPLPPNELTLQGPGHSTTPSILLHRRKTREQPKSPRSCSQSSSFPFSKFPLNMGGFDKLEIHLRQRLHYQTLR